MESIVVGFDGAEPSLVAVDWTAERASRGPCRVEIVRIEPGVVVMGGDDAGAFSEAERRVMDVAPDAEVTSRRLIGRMPGALLRAAAQADLLVIGVRRGRPIRSALTGWRPLRTASQSPVPIVVVPGDWSGPDGPVEVGVDDDRSSVAAIEFAAGEAVAAGVGLTLVHAWQMPAPTMDGAVALLASPLDVRAAHRRILDAASARVTALHPGLPVQKTLVQDDPASALLTGAGRSSLIVIGSHRRGLLAGAFLGSVAQDTLVASRIPVCIVPTTPDGQ